VSKPIGDQGSCILAWTAALFVPAALVFGLGWPWLEYARNLEHEIETIDDQTARYHRLLQTLPGLQAELDQVRSNEDVKDFYFDAKTPALAGAQLQGEMQSMVKASGGRLVSTQVLASAEDEQPPKVRVRAQIQGKTDALLEILYQIEKARPFLFVDQMSIRSTARRTVAQRNRRVGGRQRHRSVRRRPQGQLTVRLDVFGYALGDVP
jgi:general secretion pathway protein M